jgi:CheY-like chemotaxis protein
MPAIHILLVEDERLTAMVLRSMLEHRGFRVTCAYNGLEALTSFTADPADLVVTDLKMPKMNGYELVSALRRINEKLPIIIATGIVEHQMLEGHDLKLLHKPIDPAELLRTVATLIPEGFRH